MFSVFMLVVLQLMGGREVSRADPGVVLREAGLDRQGVRRLVFALLSF